jgi:hypothetical protein
MMQSCELIGVMSIVDDVTCIQDEEQSLILMSPFGDEVQHGLPLPIHEGTLISVQSEAKATIRIDTGLGEARRQAWMTQCLDRGAGGIRPGAALPRPGEAQSHGGDKDEKEMRR